MPLIWPILTLACQIISLCKLTLECGREVVSGGSWWEFERIKEKNYCMVNVDRWLVVDVDSLG